MKRPLLLVLLFLAADANACWAQRRGPGVPPPAPRPAIPGPRPGIVPGPRPVVRPAPGPIFVHRVGPDRGDEVESFNVTVLIIVALGAVGAFIVLGFGIYFWTNRTVGHLRILDPPPGNAPEDIRRAWVGVELPLRRWEAQPILLPSPGRSDPDAPVTKGYAVDGRRAIAALASYQPDAADWWREHAPHVLAPGSRLHFSWAACERLD